MHTTPFTQHLDPYADLGTDLEGLDGVASDICPRCGPLRLTTVHGQLVAERCDGGGLCRCTPQERLAAEADQDRRRRQRIDDRARRARAGAREAGARPRPTSRSVTPSPRDRMV